METPSQNDNSTSLEKETAPLEALRQELAGLKRTEAEKKERDEKYDPHFIDIEPADLSSVDLAVYQKFKDRTLSEKEFYKYQAEFRNTPYEKINKDTRVNFAAWLANKVNLLEWLRRWHPENFPSEEK